MRAAAARRSALIFDEHPLLVPLVTSVAVAEVEVRDVDPRGQDGLPRRLDANRCADLLGGRGHRLAHVRTGRRGVAIPRLTTRWRGLGRVGLGSGGRESAGEVPAMPVQVQRR